MSEVGQCLICARPAKGIYYKVVACTGCRTFYERSIRKKNIYKCQGNGECDIQSIRYRNAWCRACRYRKWERSILEALGDKPISHVRRVKDGKKPRKQYCRPGAAVVASAPADSAESTEMEFYVASATPHLCNTSRDFSRRDESDMIAGIDSKPALMTRIREDYDVPTGDYISQNLSPFRTSLRQNTSVTKTRNETGYNYRPFLSPENHGDFNLMARTYFAVGAAMEIAFGDQISEWTTYMADALKYQKTMVQSETDVNSMLTALRDHYRKVFHRMLKFRDLIPGFRELGGDARRTTGRHWKSFLASLIHHAPFSTNEVSYFTVGPNRFCNCRYWVQKQEITIWSFQVFVYKISNFIRDIGLNQIERYLLIASILLEPEADLSSNIPLSSLHRHYTGVLVHAIEQRCSDTAEQIAICRKLESFFVLIGDATAFFTKHCVSPGACPPIYQSSRHQIHRLLQTET